METTKINPAIIEVETTLDEIVFKNRNHEYGAFAIRQSYEKTMRKSFLIGTIFFVSAIIVSNIYANRDQTAPQKWTTMNTGDYDFPPPVEPPVVIPPKVEEVKVPDVPTTEFLPPVLTTDDVDDAPPTQETLSTAPPADVTNVGDPNDVSLIPEEGPKEETIVTVAPVEDKEFIIVEEAAEYPGGVKKLSEFLSKNLKYPQQAIRSGISGKVFLSFGVDKNGNIYDVNVVKGIGFNCDEEAVRVVKLMPKWKPGRQSGNAVKSRFNLPIAFMLE